MFENSLCGDDVPLAVEGGEQLRMKTPYPTFPFSASCPWLGSSKYAWSIQSSLEPRSLRKFFSVATKLAAAQRKAIEPSCQCVTRRVLLRAPENDDSMTFVEHKPRLKSAGNPRRLTVNISAKPSRRLAAAEG